MRFDPLYVKLDPANGPDFETARRNIKIGKVTYIIIGILALGLTAKSFSNLGGIIQGERFVDSIENALDKIKEEEN